MTWRTKRTSIDVDLSEFGSDQLLQGLIDGGRLTPEEAFAISERGKQTEKPLPFLVSDGIAFGDELDRARMALARHNKPEALHYIERHLGREWIGELQ
jgi:hypothetical protein